MHRRDENGVVKAEKLEKQDKKGSPPAPAPPSWQRRHKQKSQKNEIYKSFLSPHLHRGDGDGAVEAARAQRQPVAQVAQRQVALHLCVWGGSSGSSVAVVWQ